MSSCAHPLQAHLGPLRTEVGAFFAGERAVFREHDLHADLADAEWIELYVLGITGRRLGKAALRVINTLWVYTSYPDTRLWNNRVAALAGSTRSSGNLGVSAALAVSEASIYGRQIDLRAMDFLLRARATEDETALHHLIHDELKTRRSIAGYGRPLINGDERLAPMRRVLRETGFDQGVHLRLAERIEHILLNGRWRFKLNYAGLAAAVCADLGLSPREYYAVAFPTFLAGMQPCNIEAQHKPPAAIMPMTCSMVDYTGATPRDW